MSSNRIYLDFNSTTPLLPEVWQAMESYALRQQGNPASAHRSGALARRTLENCRERVANCLGAHPREVFFTSGATEANNLALFGLMVAGGELALSRIEHPSVWEPARKLAAEGIPCHEIEVDPLGYVHQLPALPAGSLIVLQLANHETGTVQKLAKLRAEFSTCRWHTDATQVVGKIPVHFHVWNVTTLSCSAHKFYGPPGIGALLVREGTTLQPRLWGGHQQQGLRPGTEPVMLVVGFTTALEQACREMESRRNHCLKLRQRFLQSLAAETAFIVNGDSEHGLVHTLNLSFPGCPSELLFIRLDLAGIDCSTGSACSSGSLLPSPVLQAMHLGEERWNSAMRFSLSHLLREEEVVEGARRVGREVSLLRSAMKNA
ncbi:MAG TPA: cysteine desulfurase family protein [Gemmatales bacterium]|nr:cysteine desulfurase family protein [Gemmatales bacterium]